MPRIAVTSLRAFFRVLQSKREVLMSPSGKQTSAAVREVVLAELNGKKYDFRTIAGIAGAAGLTPESVAAALKDLSDVVRESPVPDAHGNALYTLRSRPRSAREIISETRAFLAGSTR
jgi:hypothetical protein